MDNQNNYEEFLSEILITEENLQKRIAELGAQISKDFQNRNPLLICILKGSVMFLTDLMKNLTIPHTIDFMDISSYGIGVRQSTGTVRITKDLKEDIFGRHVIIVEDIVDSGHTIAAVIELLNTRRPKTLQVCSLLDKATRREVDVPMNYIGFDIEDKFVFGYGLDIDEFYRNLPFIGVVDLNKYTPPE